ncbi:hypothetical protein KR018_000987, partial [Drosophila ironensis]
NFGALISLIKCVVGTGILALPLAFHYAGMLLGAIFLIVIMFLLTYGLQLLIMCMVECARRMKAGYVTYPDAMGFSFSQGPAFLAKCSKAGGWFADIVLSISHYGICTIYVVFVSLNFKQTLDQYTTAIDKRIYMAIVGLLLMPFFMIRYLKHLVPLNITANLLLYIGFALIFSYLVRGLGDITERPCFGDPTEYPLFFGIAMFAIASVGVMLAIESKMAKPQDFLGWIGVLDYAMLFVLVSYMAFGVIGYWKYGDSIAASLTLSLPKDDVMAQVIKVLIAIDIFLSYPLSGYVVIDIIMTHYWNKSGELEHAIWKEYILRVCFVIVTTINAIVFPNLGPLLSLFGSFTISLLNLIFPAVMELCLLYPEGYDYGKYRWKLIKNILLIILGAIICVYGTATALLEAVKTYS